MIQKAIKAGVDQKLIEAATQRARQSRLVVFSRRGAERDLHDILDERHLLSQGAAHDESKEAVH